MINIAQAQGGSERGFIEDTSAASIRATIEDDYQTVTQGIGETVSLTGGAKQTELTSLDNRIDQDPKRRFELAAWLWTPPGATPCRPVEPDRRYGLHWLLGVREGRRAESLFADRRRKGICGVQTARAARVAPANSVSGLPPSPMVPEQVRWKERVAYGAGDLASCLYWNTFSLFLLIFYTDTFGISPAAAGTMLLVTRTVDAVFDPFMGMIGDRTRSRWGRFRPWLLWMCAPFAVSGVLAFTTPNLSQGGKLIYAYITYALVMLCYSAINIPYGAMLGVITPDSAERTRLSTCRFLGAFTGNLIVQGTLLYLVAGFGSGNWGFHNVAAIEHLKVGKKLSASEAVITQHGFPWAVGVYAVLAAALFLFAFAMTRERVTAQKKHSSSVRQDLRDVLRNRPWLVLSGANLVFLIWVSMRGAATAYYFKYFVGNSELMFSWLTLGTVASVLGVAATEPVTRWLGGRKSAYIWLQLLNAATCGLLFFAGPSNYVLIYATQIIGSFIGGPLNPLIWAMYADTADYAEWRFGRPSTGLLLSAGTFAQKTGWTVGGAIAGWLLAYYGFEAGTMQSTATLNGIVLMMSLLPAVASIATAVAALFYNLDRRRQQLIEAELKVRRAAPPAATAE